MAKTLLLLCCLAALAAAQHVLDDDEAADSVIVKLAADTFSVQSTDGAAAADAAGDLGQPIGRHLRRVAVQPGESAREVADRLAAMPGVEYAAVDRRVWAEVKTAAFALPDNKGWKLQWGIHRIGMADAWKLAKGAESRKGAVTLCVVDSGVDYKHPDLMGNLAEGVGFNAVDGEDKEDPRDQVGHGTQVAGIMAGSGSGKGGAVGVNRDNINLLSCKFMSADGFGRTSDAVQCLDYCVDKGAHIISASWTSGQLANPPMEEAIARVAASGALLVVSAGNQGVNLKANKFYPQAYASQHPDSMVVVGATDEYDDMVAFSNWDKEAVHLSAPGNMIYTTIMGGGYTFASGTSIAAPFVSGSAALLLAAAQDRLGKSLSAKELKQLLLDSAEALPQLRGRSATGGRLRTDWALQKLLGKELSPPTPCKARPGHKSKCKEQQAKRRSMLMGLDGPAPRQPAAAEAVAEAQQEQQREQQRRWRQERPWEAAHLGQPSRRMAL